MPAARAARRTFKKKKNGAVRGHRAAAGCCRRAHQRSISRGTLLVRAICYVAARIIIISTPHVTPFGGAPSRRQRMTPRHAASLRALKDAHKRAYYARRRAQQHGVTS